MHGAYVMENELIKMRWLEFPLTLENGVKLQGKKLQYQFLQFPPMGWSEWIDIPTETEK